MRQHKAVLVLFVVMGALGVVLVHRMRTANFEKEAQLYARGDHTFSSDNHRGNNQQQQQQQKGQMFDRQQPPQQ